MNDDTKNKVCFDCAGVPVIRRIIARMRRGGVSRFVLVIGHRAETVMDSLANEHGIIYAYQKEQCGTGHAARCGLEALAELGYTERVIVSMGDKIISSDVIRRLVEASAEADVVWGIQPIAANPGGGRVVVADGTPYGVVELADVAYQSLAEHPCETWQDVLADMRLNAKKASKVLERATSHSPVGFVTLNGRQFTASELRTVSYANAGLYCFKVGEALEALADCGADNAQKEIYLTDTLERFAANGVVRLLEIERAEDMLTFSTRPELREISRHFLPDAQTCLKAIQSDAWCERFADVYGTSATGQKERYAKLVEAFLERHGNLGVIIARAPGRVNLMGRHIDHRGGCTNVMAIDRDTVMIASPRNDDTISVSSIDDGYSPASFSISECLDKGGGTTDWLSYLDAPQVIAELSTCRGHWMNYIKAAVLRFQMASDLPLYGMDIVMTGNIPVAAGLSSSSSVVVATAEVLTGLNCLNISEGAFIDLCGEGEWFVGSRGGASDHAAMKCAKRNCIRQLKFHPFAVGDSFPFPEGYAVIVADSCQQARKSEGSKDAFNARVASYECAFMLLRKAYAQRGWREFRELADVSPSSDVYRMLKTLPVVATRADLYSLLPTQHAALDRIFATHTDPGTYDLRGVALFGISECSRSKLFGSLLEKKEYAAIGRMMKTSHDGDRLTGWRFSDSVLDSLAEADTPLWQQSGAYGCSTSRIDEMCDLLNATQGVLGCSLAGAGLGGSVIVLAEANVAPNVIEMLNRNYYDKYGLPHSAGMYRPGVGSRILTAIDKM